MTKLQIVPITVIKLLWASEPVTIQPISDMVTRPMSCQTNALTIVRRFVSMLVLSPRLRPSCKERGKHVELRKFDTVLLFCRK